MSELLQKIVNRNFVAGIVGGIAIGAGATAGIYEGVSAPSGETCESPPDASMPYAGDPHATDNQATWTTGVEVDTKNMPPGTELAAGYVNAGSNEWHDSDPIAGDLAKKIILRIGPGTVAFRTELIAKSGSGACDVPPSSHFSEPQPVQKLLDKGAVELTWPNK